MLKINNTFSKLDIFYKTPVEQIDRYINSFLYCRKYFLSSEHEGIIFVYFILVFVISLIVETDYNMYVYIDKLFSVLFFFSVEDEELQCSIVIFVHFGVRNFVKSDSVSLDR